MSVVVTSVSSMCIHISICIWLLFQWGKSTARWGFVTDRQCCLISNFFWQGNDNEHKKTLSNYTILSPREQMSNFKLAEGTMHEHYMMSLFCVKAALLHRNTNLNSLLTICFWIWKNNSQAIQSWLCLDSCATNFLFNYMLNSQSKYIRINDSCIKKSRAKRDKQG